MTLCETCASREENGPWWRWTCRRSPKPVPRQFVVSDPWLTESPFERCKDVNESGNCELYEKQSDEKPQNERAA